MPMKDKPARLTRAELETLHRLKQWLKQSPPGPAAQTPDCPRPHAPTPGEE
jgi:hypothetical protein